MFYHNSHHLFDALQIDTNGNKLPEIECMTAFLIFSNDINQYENDLISITASIRKMPGKISNYEAEFRHYVWYSTFRAISVARNIMTDPAPYIRGEFHNVFIKDVLCARSLIEVVAMFLRSYSIFTTKLSCRGDFKEWMRKYAFSTNLSKNEQRNKNVTLGGLVGLEDADRIGKAISQLSQRKVFVEKYYHIFSEFCHPNGMGLYIAEKPDDETNYGYSIAYALSQTLSLLTDFKKTAELFVAASPLVSAI